MRWDPRHLPFNSFLFAPASSVVLLDPRPSILDMGARSSLPPAPSPHPTATTTPSGFGLALSGLQLFLTFPYMLTKTVFDELWWIVHEQYMLTVGETLEKSCFFVGPWRLLPVPKILFPQHFFPKQGGGAVPGGVGWRGSGGRFAAAASGRTVGGRGHQHKLGGGVNGSKDRSPTAGTTGAEKLAFPPPMGASSTPSVTSAYAPTQDADCFTYVLYCVFLTIKLCLHPGFWVRLLLTGIRLLLVFFCCLPGVCGMMQLWHERKCTTIQYGESAVRNVLDVYEPFSRAAAGPPFENQVRLLPVVVLVSGVGWAVNHRSTMTLVAEHLAQSGEVVVVVVEYRCFPQAGFSSMVDDWAGSGRYRKEPQNPQKLYTLSFSCCPVRSCLLVCE